MTHPSGSKAATEGFSNERQVVNSFNAKNAFAEQCFAAMHIPVTASVKAMHVSHIQGESSLSKLLELTKRPTSSEVSTIRKFQKADIRLRITESDRSSHLNLSLKKTAKANFNQVECHSVLDYQEALGFDDEVCLWLRLFTGAVTETELEMWTNGLTVDGKRGRVIFHQFPSDKKEKILSFLESKKRQIISDAVRGRGPLCADFVMVTHQTESETRAHVSPVEAVIDHLSVGNAEASHKSSIRLGGLTIQRRGGTPNPSFLQLKMKPRDLFDVEGVTIKFEGQGSPAG
jgi:hypothetical protein